MALLPLFPAHAADVKEQFLNVSEGALLSTLPNWTHPSSEEDTWTVTNLGADGGVMEAASKGAYHRVLTEKEWVQPGDTRTFRYKIRFTGSDSWTSVQIDLLEAGGINGASLRFDGGESEGSGDNRVGLSESGSSWGNIQYRWSEARWRPNVWYQVEITNVIVSSAGISGMVTIFDANNPAEKLVENQPLAAFGNPGSFKRIDTIAISSTGAARPFQIGNIELNATKPTP